MAKVEDCPEMCIRDRVVLFPHLPALGKGSDPALGLDDLSAQVIVTACLLYTS